MKQVQINALLNCVGAADNKLEYGLGDRFTTRELSGTMRERSSSVLRSLVDLGYLETDKKSKRHRQGQHYWRVTEAGREIAPTLQYSYEYDL